MIRIGILGYAGRMGRLIAEAIADREGCALAGGAVHELKAPPAKAEGVLITTQAKDVFAASDVIIDFSAAVAVPDHLRLAVTHGKPLVCGVTGVDSATMALMQDAARTIPLLYAANTSVSLAALKPVVALAAKMLGGFDYDVAITDEHHRMKKDAPSGTAKALGDAVLQGNKGKKHPSYASVRAGHIVGEHEVLFAGQGEIIRLHHSVTDRRVFARGAVEAALWLQGKPQGFYGMDDVLGLGK